MKTITKTVTVTLPALTVERAKELGTILAEADSLNFGGGKVPKKFEESPFPFFAERVEKTGRHKQTYANSMKAHEEAVKYGLMDKDGSFIKSKHSKKIVNAFENQFEF